MPIEIPKNPINYNDWKILHADSLTTNWEKNWAKDADGDIVNDAQGMTISTNKYIEVVWFKEMLPENYLITFEWTSLQSGRSLTSIREPLGDRLFNGLNAGVFYLNAKGINGKPENVLEWCNERKDGVADHYQKNMTNVRISYSTPQTTVRFVQSTGDRYLAQIKDEGIFTQNEPFYFEIKKIGPNLLMRVTNMNSGTARVFEAKMNPELCGGHFALRQMDRRDIRYRNFRLYYYEPQEVPN